MSRLSGRVLQVSRRPGFTLIELILAMAIASLVVTLIFSTYHTVTVTLQGQQDRRRGADKAADAVRQIERDLTCAFAPKSDAACAFELQKGTTPAAARLSFCTAVMPANETDLRWFELRRVVYGIGADAENAPVLFRAEQPLAGPGAFAPPVTNALATGVESFRVSVYDGAEWSEEWSSAGSSCPRAARIELTARHGSGTNTFQTEVLIPAGNPVTSSVSRAGVPAHP